MAVDVTDYSDLTRTRAEWSKDSRCGKLPNAWKLFDQRQGRPQRRPAWWNICNDCPVKKECLAFAIVHNEEGVWGGTTDSQRILLAPLVRTQMLAQAQEAGWFEPQSYYEAPALRLVVSREYVFEFPDIEAFFA